MCGGDALRDRRSAVARHFWSCKPRSMATQLPYAKDDRVYIHVSCTAQTVCDVQATVSSSDPRRAHALKRHLTSIVPLLTPFLLPVSRQFTQTPRRSMSIVLIVLCSIPAVPSSALSLLMSDSAPSPPPAEAPVSAGGPSGFLKVSPCLDAEFPSGRHARTRCSVGCRAGQRELERAKERSG